MAPGAAKSPARVVAGFMVFACPFDRRLELERVLGEAGVQLRPFSFTTQGVHAWSVEVEQKA